MNELKLSLHNFQSISDGELVFNTGLNFIIGQSNSGKSATFRALKACLLNPKGSQRFIKKGNNKSVVTLFYNGNEIEWDRTTKESSYIINGEQYIKTGASDSFKILMDNTGFVKEEKEGVLMNIEEELQLPFPFGITKSDLFKLFENVFCVSDSAVILKAAKGQEDGIKDNIEALEMDGAKIQSKLVNLEEFKETVNLEQLQKCKEYLKTKEERINFLEKDLDIINRAIKLEEAKLEVGERVFDNLFSPYLEALEIKKVLTRLKTIHKLSKDLQELIMKKEFKNNLECYENLINLNKTLQKLKKLNKLSVTEKEFKSNLDQYKDLTDLNKTLQKLKKLNKLSISEKEFKSKLDKYKELRDLWLYIQTFQRKVKDLQIDKKREEERISGIEAKLKEFKVCPLCHRPLEN